MNPQEEHTPDELPENWADATEDQEGRLLDFMDLPPCKWLEYSDIPDADEIEDEINRSWLNGHVNAKRKKQLADGAALTKTEAKLLQDEWATRVWDDDDPEADLCALVNVIEAPTKSSKPQWVIYYARGCDALLTLECKLLGVFKTKDEAFAYLQKHGRLE